MVNVDKDFAGGRTQELNAALLPRSVTAPSRAPDFHGGSKICASRTVVHPAVDGTSAGREALRSDDVHHQNGPLLGLATGPLPLEPNGKGYSLLLDCKGGAPLPECAWALQVSSDAEVEVAEVALKPPQQLEEAYAPNVEYELFRVVLAAEGELLTLTLTLTLALALTRTLTLTLTLTGTVRRCARPARRPGQG